MISFYFSQLSPHTKKLCKLTEDMTLKNIFALMYTALAYIDANDPLYKEIRIDYIYLCEIDRDSISIDSHLPTRSSINSLITIHDNFSAYGLTFYHFNGDTKRNLFPFVNEFADHLTIEDELIFVHTFKCFKKIRNLVETESHIRFSNNHIEYFYNRKLNIVHRRIKRNLCYHAFYFKDSQNVKYRFRNKNLNLLSFYGVFPDFHIFAQKVAECNSKFRSSIESDPRNFRLRSNPVWRDLNYSFRETEPIPKNLYAQLKRRHGKLSTKELRNFFFGTSYKSLQKILSTFTIRMIDTFKSVFIPLSLKYNLTVDQQARYLANIPSRTSTINTALEDIDNLLNKGYSFNRILNYVEANNTYQGARNFIDSLMMLKADNIWNDANCNVNDSIETIHTKLISATNRIRDAAYSRPIPLTDYEISLNTTIDEYQFKVANITDDLSLLGNKLRICVRSYDSRAINKSCTIVGVYKDSVPIACLELRPPATNGSTNYTINQAKLERNDQVKYDEVLLPIVLSWLDSHSITIDTRDLTDAPLVNDSPPYVALEPILALINQ